MFERKYGSKAIETKNLSTTQIAAEIRADIKELVRVGALPKGKYSVTSRYYSGGSAIDIRVKGLTNQPMLTPEYTAARRTGTWSGGVRYTSVMSNTLEVLNALHRAYNFDGSDSQYDHFDTRFYGNAEIDCQAENTEAPWGVDKA